MGRKKETAWIVPATFEFRQFTGEEWSRLENAIGVDLPEDLIERLEEELVLWSSYFTNARSLAYGKAEKRQVEKLCNAAAQLRQGLDDIGAFATFVDEDILAPHRVRRETFAAILEELAEFQSWLERGGTQANDPDARAALQQLDPLWDELFPAEQARIVALLIERVDIGKNGLNVRLRVDGLHVSLHYWCHHAVYLDRTFNAGHFLQSQDRIHRLGLAQDVVTRFTLLMSAGSIDDSVDGRLAEKVSALSLLMDDPGLVQIALPSADEGSGGTPAFDDDYQAVAAHIAAGNA